MTNGAEDFPYNVAEYLAECRDLGLTFDQAWTPAMTAAARAAGFSWKQQPFAVEASVPFALRHLRAAYERRDTMRYCVSDCTYLAIDGVHCVAHALKYGVEEREAA